MNRLVIPAAMSLVGIGIALALVPRGAPRDASPRRAVRPVSGPSVIPTERARVRVVTVTNALDEPWALGFLPGGDILITERAGRLRVVHQGRLEPCSIGGIPTVD